MTTKAENTAATTTAMTYADGTHLTSLAIGTGSAITLAYDALGRLWTRTAGVAETYRYTGTSDTIDQISDGATTRTSLVDATGSRLSWTSGATTAWTLFDHLGSLVALVGAGPGNPLAEVYRYDGYGQDLRDTVQTPKDAGLRNPFRFRGALNLGSDGEPLYAMGARRYAPSMGAWTSMDTYAGSAQDPASLNRFLYVHANPTSLIDPTGHKAEGCGTWTSMAACYSTYNANIVKAKKKEQAKRARAAATDTGGRGCAATGDCGDTSLPVDPPTVAQLEAWWRSASVDERNLTFATIYGRELSWLRLEQDAIPGYLACLGSDSARYDACAVDRFAQFMEQSGFSPTMLVAAAYGFRGLASPSARTGALEGDVTRVFWDSGTGRYVADTVVPAPRATVAGEGAGAVSNVRPVLFERPLGGSTAAQDAQIRAYAAACNDALCAGALSSTGRVSTHGALQRQAGRAAAAERAGHPDLYPSGVVAGHGPDTTWTGNPVPHTWLPLDAEVNASLGAQAQRYSIGYKPTGFWFVDDYVSQFGAVPGR